MWLSNTLSVDISLYVSCTVRLRNQDIYIYISNFIKSVIQIIKHSHWFWVLSVY
jgi:hypothetical protein